MFFDQLWMSGNPGRLVLIDFNFRVMAVEAFVAVDAAERM
jgi:hypothetical protein